MFSKITNEMKILCEGDNDCLLGENVSKNSLLTKCTNTLALPLLCEFFCDPIKLPTSNDSSVQYSANIFIFLMHFYRDRGQGFDIWMQILATGGRKIVIFFSLEIRTWIRRRETFDFVVHLWGPNKVCQRKIFVPI